jgi:two-component system LytT family response regulator
MKTIIVEDEINNLNLLSHFLKKYCPEVELIASCQTKDVGVKLINQLKPDLVFLDVVLEENTAFELLEEIENKELNVIFVTAFDEYALKAFRTHVK